METVEVVIRIPKRTYDRVSERGIIAYGDDAYYIGHAIKNGTVHIHDVSPTYGMEVYGVTQDDIEYEPTVIEADKEA